MLLLPEPKPWLTKIRLASVMKRKVACKKRLRSAQALQKQVAEREEASQQLQDKIAVLAEKHQGDEDLQEMLRRFQAENEELRQNYDDAQADVMVLEQDLETLKQMFQTNLEQKDQANQTLRENILRTTDLVQVFLALDQDFYGGRHQEANPADDSNEDPLADFFHDFATVSAIATSLQSDLQRLREIGKQSQDTQSFSAGNGLLKKILHCWHK